MDTKYWDYSNRSGYISLALSFHDMGIGIISIYFAHDKCLTIETQIGPLSAILTIHKQW